MAYEPQPGRDDGGSGGIVSWRIKQLEDWRRAVEEHANPILLAQDISAIKRELGSVKNLLRALVLSIIGACITFGFTVLLVLR